jgi:hypothetical protein
VVLLAAGIDNWNWFDKDLPRGIIPAVAELWYEAIKGGYFLGQ